MKALLLTIAIVAIPSLTLANDPNAFGDFISSDLIRGITRDSIKRISPIWFGISIVVLAVRYGWLFLSASFESTLMEQDSLPVNYMDMARSMFFVLLIGIFPQLYIGIESTLHGINSATEPSSDVYQNISEISNEYYINTQIAPEISIVKNAYEGYQEALKSGNKAEIKAKKLVLEETAWDVTVATMEASENLDGSVDGIDEPLKQKEGVFDSKLDILASLNPLNAAGMTLNALLAMISMGIKWIIALWAKFSFGIVGGLGMIALTFGIWNPNIPASWLSKIINIGLVFTVLNILDQQMATFWLYAFRNGLIMNGSEVGNGIALHIAVIASYASAFTLTGWVVGSSGAGKIAGKAIGISSMMVAAAAAAAAAALSAGGSAAASGAGSSVQAIGRSFTNGSKSMNNE